MKQTTTKKGNKYQKFSISGKEGEQIQKVTGKYTFVDCPKCDCCQSKSIEGKVSFCKNCLKGRLGHTKLGKPKMGLHKNE